jgi:integrase
MAKIDLPYVKTERDRQGRVTYHYFRRAGRRWRLPPLERHEEFMAAYRRLLAASEPNQAEPPTEYRAGSLGALVTQYFADRIAFGQRKPNTQRLYRLMLEPLVELHGHKPVALLERRHIEAWRDAKSDTPGAANSLVKIVATLLKYAVAMDYRKDNPAKGIELFELGEHRAWTDLELAAFERRWATGTMQRLAYMLARYTGQRCSDVAPMMRAHCNDGAIRVMQRKTTKDRTGEEIEIPIHRQLAAELALHTGRLSFLVKKDGSPFDEASLSRWFAKAIARAGLPEACVMHGLRKNAAKALAEAGCSVHEIMAITGHKSLQEVMRYTRAAQQRELATAAILRLERNGNRTRSGKRGPR